MLLCFENGKLLQTESQFTCFVFFTGVFVPVTLDWSGVTRYLMLADIRPISVIKIRSLNNKTAPNSWNNSNSDAMWMCSCVRLINCSHLMLMLISSCTLSAIFCLWSVKAWLPPPCTKPCHQAIRPLCQGPYHHPTSLPETLNLATSSSSPPIPCPTMV